MSQKRAPCSTCFELLLPMLVIALLVVVRNAFSISDEPDSTYCACKRFQCKLLFVLFVVCVCVCVAAHYVQPARMFPDGTGEIFDYNRFLYRPQGSRTDRFPRVAFTPNNEFGMCRVGLCCVFREC